MKARIWFEAKGQSDAARGIEGWTPRWWPVWARHAYFMGMMFHRRGPR